MSILDPENNESRALLDIVNFNGQHVFEIGCGDGRLTWLYADKPLSVTAIDPVADQIALARQQLPAYLQDRIEFQAIGFEDFAANTASSAFDIVILSHSL
jgi:2-polyprenyl-3-methyl-5-hydroxy-6-metoxy-1,4-benzoquinol methylase